MIQDKELVEIKTQVSSIKNLASSLTIDSSKTLEIARGQLKVVSDAEKFITSRKEEITRPLMKSLASVRDLFKPFESDLGDAKKLIKDSMLSWQIAEEKRIEAKKAKIAAKVEKGTMRVDTAMNKMEEIGEVSKAGIRTLKKVRVTDKSIVPIDYLEPNMTLIADAVIKKGLSIPGCEIYEEKIIAVR